MIGFREIHTAPRLSTAGRVRDRDTARGRVNVARDRAPASRRASPEGSRCRPEIPARSRPTDPARHRKIPNPAAIAKFCVRSRQPPRGAGFGGGGDGHRRMRHGPCLARTRPWRVAARSARPCRAARTTVKTFSTPVVIATGLQHASRPKSQAGHEHQGSAAAPLAADRRGSPCQADGDRQRCPGLGRKAFRVSWRDWVQAGNDVTLEVETADTVPQGKSSPHCARLLTGLVRHNSAG